MFFTVTLSHPDGPAWREHLEPHLDFIKAQVASGRIVASGQLLGRPLRSGFYIAKVADRAEVETLVAEDPFTPAGVMASVEIHEWKPFFGLFADQVEAPDWG